MYRERCVDYLGSKRSSNTSLDKVKRSTASQVHSFNTRDCKKVGTFQAQSIGIAGYLIRSLVRMKVVNNE